MLDSTIFGLLIPMEESAAGCRHDARVRGPGPHRFRARVSGDCQSDAVLGPQRDRRGSEHRARDRDRVSDPRQRLDHRRSRPLIKTPSSVY